MFNNLFCRHINKMETQDRENVDAYEVCLRYIEAK